MPSVDRRDFLKLVGAGGVGAGAGFMLAESRKYPVEHLIPHPQAPEDFSAGIATWYNSVCKMCSSGCGISVRTLDGRAKLITGNASHPVSQGKLCAQGQAGLNALYNPDRLSSPMRMTEAGAFEPTSWQEGLAELGGQLDLLRSAGRGNRIAILTSGLSGHLGILFEEFAAALGTTRMLQYDFAREENWHAASQRFFNRAELPYYDIANSNLVISFGADFLTNWISPVHHSIGFGASRQDRPGQRGRFVQIEPRMSLSGASADEWVPAIPGSEGILALGMARRIVTSGGYAGEDLDAWQAALDQYTPASVAEQTGVAADTVQRLADAFIESQPGIAIGGGAVGRQTNGLGALTAVNALNYLAGNPGRAGGVIFNPAPAFGPANSANASYADLTDLVAAAHAGEIDVLITHDVNPVYHLPVAGFDDALDAIPLVASLSSFADETSAHADLLLPSHTYLEDWADSTPQPGVGFRSASVQQPVVAPLYDTRGTGDIVLSLVREMGLDSLIPDANMEAYLQRGWQSVYAPVEEPVPVDEAVAEEAAVPVEEPVVPAGFDAFWTDVVRAGVWGDETRAAQDGVAISPDAIANIGVDPAEFDGAEGEYPFVLHPYLSATFGDGRGANLPWLQELPDPLTGVVYGSWIELNPATAAELGLSDGDVVTVQSTAGSIETPVLIYPAIMPNVVAIPIGQGHSNYGRYANGRGVNPLEIVAAQTDADTGAFAWAATRVVLTPTGRSVSITRVGGESRERGQEIIQTAATDASGANASLNSIPIKVVNT